MRNFAEDEKYFLIRVVLACFFVSALFFAAPIYADGQIAVWGGRKLPDQLLTDMNHIAAGGSHSLGL
ncbi:MAG: hypothetical protein ACYST9_03885, partial [Planctomycetota bacterium]